MSAKKFASFIDQCNSGLSRVVSWFGLLMVLLTFIIVVLRYGFNLGWIAMQETVMYLHACVFMFGAAYTLQQDQHVRVDVFYAHMTRKRKALVDLLGSLLLLLPVSVFIFVSSWQYVLASWFIHEGSPETGGLPFLYVLKSLILIFSALLTLQAISECLKAWQRLQNKERG